MNVAETTRVGLDAIWAHKLRSFLTLLGIIIGVATVIAVVMMVEGFNTYFNEKVADLGSNAFVIRKVGFVTSMEEMFEQNRKNKNVTLDDMEAIINNPRRQFVLEAAARLSSGGELKYGSQTLTDITIEGVSHNMVDIDQVKVAEGRYISQEDEQRRRYVCFIGSNVERELFPSIDPIDRELKVAGLPFRVIGVAEELGTVMGQPQDNYVNIPISTYMKIFGSRRSISIRVAAINGDAISHAIDEVRVVLRNRRHLKYAAEDNFGIITSDSLKEFRDSALGTIQLVSVGVASIALIVGGIVVMNIMLVSVTERTREIGIRKSMGARRADILWQFLVESVTLALLGGAIGIGLAYSGGKIVSYFTDFLLVLPLGWTIAATVVSAAVGLFSGVYPAYKAAGLDPVEALRSE
ncbi:MAG: ABC transporter permease [Acidobacteria bacterium]|nr:ABC transporter permease [Acidobacteriota bacterium]